jgi:phospholipid/cholesterol/gamma-HCH transport system permease protein
MASTLQGRMAPASSAPADAMSASRKSSARAKHLPFSVEREEGRVVLTGELTMRHAGALWRRLSEEVDDASGQRLDLDLSGVTHADGAAVALLVELRAALSGRAIECDLVGGSELLRELVTLYGGERAPTPRPKRVKERGVARFGGGVASVLQAIERWVAFVGSVAAGAAGVVARPRTSNFRSLITLSERAGADARADRVPADVPRRLRDGVPVGRAARAVYGADVYVADRRGDVDHPRARAADDGHHRERSLRRRLRRGARHDEACPRRSTRCARWASSPVRFLVFPRVLALALVAPALTLLGDVIGVAGGAAVGALSLEVTPRAYLAELRSAVFFSDVWTGLVKSVGFGIAIGLIGCQQGFATSGGAAGVGRRTTVTVVTCLFAIVILDTLFTVFFRMLGV